MIRLDAPDRVTIVSGLPRAGTSLLMQLLEAAGLSLARDDERSADPDNPRGYHELAAVKRIRSDASFVASCRGRVVKIVAPLLTELPDVDPRRDAHRVLFVERGLEEVLASQRVMLARRGEAVPIGEDAALARAFEGALARARAWLVARPSIDVLFVDHEALVARPAQAVERILAFLARTGSDRIPDAAFPAALAELAAVRSAMERVVDPTLHRQRVGSPAPRA